jgi:transcriptional regulator with XRE-family HTH domain
MIFLLKEMTKELNYRIRKIREVSGLTQEEVASKCGMSASAYGQIERNASKSTYDTLLKIAKALNVTITFLIDTGSENYEF